MLFVDINVPVSVSASGTFSQPVSVSGNCAQGATGILSGSFSGTTATATFTGAACGNNNITITGQAALNAPFPQATSAGPPTISFPGANIQPPVITTPLATCSGCGGGTQAAVAGEVAVLATNVQITSIGLRLASLRGGATGVSVSGLSLKVAGQQVPWSALTNLGGGASADANGFMKRLGLFAIGQGSFGDQNARTDAAAFDFQPRASPSAPTTASPISSSLGLAFGYLRTKSEIDAVGGESAVNGYSLSAYANYYVLQDLYVDGIVTFGGNTYDFERPTEAAIATGDTNGTQFAVSVSSGYAFRAGGLTFGPTVRVNYVNVFIDGYQEARPRRPTRRPCSSATASPTRAGTARRWSRSVAPRPRSRASSPPTRRWSGRSGWPTTTAPMRPAATRAAPTGPSAARARAPTAQAQLGAIPSLSTQINNYLTATGGIADSRALYTVWGGANDLFAIAGGAPAQTHDARRRSVRRSATLPR